MSLEQKIERAIEICVQRGMRRTNVYPSFFAVLKTKGICLRPPVFYGFWTIGIGSTIYFSAILSGILFLADDSSGMLIPVMSVAMGLLAGIFLGVFYKVYYKSLNLPDWEEI